MVARVDYSNKSVLLIDSSGNLRATVKSMLQGMGFSSITTTSISSQVLDIVVSGDFDLILIGHNIHDAYTGLQLLEEARHKGLIKPTCGWVLMTSDASQQSVLFAIEVQPDELLTKPFTLDILSRRIQQLCVRRAALEPIQRAIERKAINRAVALCDSLLKPSDACYSKAQMIKGRLLLDQSKYLDAKAVFETLYWADKAQLPGYYLAECHYQLAEFEPAQQLLQALLTEHPLLILAYDLQGRVYEAAGDLVSSQKALQLAVEYSPLSIPRQMELGRLSVRTRELLQAEKAYRRCIHLGENSCLDSAAPYLKLANVQRLQIEQGGDVQRQDAMAQIEALLDLASHRFQRDQDVRIQTQLMRAKVQETLGDADEAQRSYERALQYARLRDVEIDLDRMRAEILDERVPLVPTAALVVPAGDVANALAAPAKDAPKLDPVMSAKVNRIGVRNYLADKQSQAIRYFALAFEYDPKNVRALLNLAQLFLEAARDTPSRSEERLRMYRRYIRLAERLPVIADEKSRLVLLQACAKQALDQLPQGSLAPLLK
ncbi:MAG: tetratricopeptide (TPR) repeat protein [Motiliproteus sp.]